MVSKCIAARLAGAAAEYLYPSGQHGVGVTKGLERIVHHLRNTVDKNKGDPDFVVLKVDIRNAFTEQFRKRIRCSHLADF